MKIATLVEPEKIVLSEIDKPVPKENEILIQVEYIGICGSDIHAYYGKHPFISCPITPGHEFVGRVVEAGSGVRGIAPGELVTGMPQLFCHSCGPCREGRYNICDTLQVIGCQTPGAACEYFAFDAALAKKIPAGMGAEIAATIEPVAVGVHAVGRGERVRGKNVVVLGAGTIGNVTAQAAMARGAKSVLITDLSEERLEIARRCGIPHTVNTGVLPLEEAMRAAFGGEGADIFFECVGVGATVNEAIALSKKGRDIVILGVFGAWPDINMGLVQDKELRLIGSLMYTEEDYDETIDCMNSGAIRTEPIISKIFPLEEYAQAFQYIEHNAGKCMKVLVRAGK